MYTTYYPKSASGSGEAVFSNKHAEHRGDGSPCRVKKSCLESYGTGTGMYFLQGFGHIRSPVPTCLADVG